MRKAKATAKLREATQLPLPELFEMHRDEVHDFLFQLLGKADTAHELLKKVYRFSKERFGQEHYQRYVRAWFLRIAATCVRDQLAQWKRHRQTPKDLPLAFLPLDESMVLLLRERHGLAKNEIASVLEITSGAVETRLLSARERSAKQLLHWSSPNPFSFAPRGQYNALKARIAVNRALDGEIAEVVDGEEVAAYRRGLEQVRGYFHKLPKQAAPEISYETGTNKRKRTARQLSNWEALPWHYKLGIECGAFALVGTLAVFVLPAFLAYYDGSSDVMLKKVAVAAPMASKITLVDVDESGRAPGSISSANGVQPVEDEFTYAEFPSGDNHLEGSAPLAPSRKGGAIYRLIVQSENPRELIPKIKSLFVASNVTERDRSGSQMPGGVYFDAVTTEDDYTKILSALSAIAPTKPYQNSKRRGRGEERARLIIWVQQI